MQGQYSLRSPAVKRLMKEAQELREPHENYHAQPLEDNLFEWHFTIRGPDDSEFNGGIYHGRIILPPDYPMKPPSIIILTPNGRFEVHTKICLSISGHHPESWQPSWSIRTALLAIIGFMPTHGGGAIGSLDYSQDERKKLAKKSEEYKCPACGSVTNILPPVTEASKADNEEAKELASQISFKGEVKKGEGEKSPDPATPASTSSPAPPNTNLPRPPFPGWPQSSTMPGGMPGTMPPFMMMPPTTTTGSSQMRPIMNYSQFAMMQSMMQQQIQAGRSGMRMSWGGMPGFPTSAAESSGQTVTVSNTATTSSTSTPVSSPSQATTSSDTQPVVSAPQSSSPTITPQSATQPTPTTPELRQRTPSPPSRTPSNTPAELPRRPLQQSPSVLTTVVMVILASAILLLLLRRMHMMGIIQFEQDGEL